MLLKIEPSEITPFFYNNFFGFDGDFPLATGVSRGERSRIFEKRKPKKEIFIKIVKIHHSRWLLGGLLELHFC